MLRASIVALSKVWPFSGQSRQARSPMALKLDTSRAARSHDELHALTQAVLEADPREMETGFSNCSGELMDFRGSAPQPRQGR